MPKFIRVNKRRLMRSGMLESGVIEIKIAFRLDVAQSVISRLYTRFYQTATTSERPGVVDQQKLSQMKTDICD